MALLDSHISDNLSGKQTDQENDVHFPVTPHGVTADLQNNLLSVPPIFP